MAREQVCRDVALIPGGWFVLGIVASMAVLALLMAQAGLTLDPLAVPDWPYYCVETIAFTVVLACRAPHCRWQRVAHDGAEFFGLFLLTCMLGALASYPLAAESHGFRDAWLQRGDHALHFDWIAWYGFIARHPAFQLLGALAYKSIFVTPVILLAYFAGRGMRAEARRFIAIFWLAAVLTLVLFAVMPAEGPLAFLWRGHIPYMPASALYQAQLIPQLRSHAVHGLTLATLHGLVSAPSFHTTSAFLFIAAAWPIRPLRWAIFGLNLAMLLATPVEGTHYLVDMIAGAAVALVATATIRAAEFRLKHAANRLPISGNRRRASYISW